MNARRSLAGMLLITVWGLLAVACGSDTTQSEPKTPESENTWPEESKPSSEPPPSSSEAVSGCPGDKPSEPRQCKSNEDCCQGYACSVDPERSHVIKYCLE